jgi:hypothetical protein
MPFMDFMSCNVQGGPMLMLVDDAFILVYMSHNTQVNTFTRIVICVHIHVTFLSMAYRSMLL